MTCPSIEFVPCVPSAITNTWVSSTATPHGLAMFLAIVVGPFAQSGRSQRFTDPSPLDHQIVFGGDALSSAIRRGDI